MRLEQALEHVFHHEGGWADHPSDPGGKTNLGITIGTLRRALRDGILSKQTNETDAHRLRRLSRPDAERIYRAYYWDEVQASYLPDGVDLLVFDAAVNQGPARAMKFLQRAAGTAADGIYGPNTKAAVDRTPVRRLIRDVSVHRALHYSSLSKLTVFGKGWFRRLFEIHAAAILATQGETV
jgi:lysozyme family protein